MKRKSMGAMILSAAVALGAAGCHPPGKPGFRPETMRPDQTLQFNVLYKSNCSACHGDQGLNGAGLPMDNPVYLAWAGHDRLVQIVSNGIPNTLMPAFAYSGGGFLSDQQVENIVNGMISHWGKSGASDAANTPGYTPSSKGDVAAGKTAFQMHCARCHGDEGQGPSPGASKPAHAATGSIVDPTFLSLASDQGLRDIVVSGLPGEGMPDWRGGRTAQPMTDKDVTDVVAWLTSHRVQSPGQPFPGSPPASAEPPAKGK